METGSLPANSKSGSSGSTKPVVQIINISVGQASCFGKNLRISAELLRKLLLFAAKQNLSSVAEPPCTFLAAPAPGLPALTLAHLKQAVVLYKPFLQKIKLQTSVLVFSYTCSMKNAFPGHVKNNNTNNVFFLFWFLAILACCRCLLHNMQKF